MSDTKSVLLVGVGGQGTILASKILSTGLLEAGYDVKMSEVHGMSQRGGAVSSQVRYGSEVCSPIIGRGAADILVSFEAMEALRWLDYLKPGGKVVVNDYRIPSSPILSGAVAYPADVLETVRAAADTTVVDAAGIAASLGNPRAMNIVLLGALVGALEASGALAPIDWKEKIRASVKPAFLELNIAAFAAGVAAVGGGSACGSAVTTGSAATSGNEG
jgi:indolepyruvate ferredoxin oxidoreductase beta subunit